MCSAETWKKPGSRAGKPDAEEEEEEEEGRGRVLDVVPVAARSCWVRRREEAEVAGRGDGLEEDEEGEEVVEEMCF